MNHDFLPFAATGELLAKLQWQPLMEDDGIPLAIMGLFVVFSALLLVCGFIGLLPRIMAFLDRLAPEQTEANASTHRHAELTDEVSPEILAVIAAVVADTVRVPHRIVRTRELSSEDLNWTLEGRRQHHASHRIERRDHR
ncbi:OadG family protein [Pirellulales bacterium]|nr:OadG family protein [Pirellulales bacterium]